MPLDIALCALDCEWENPAANFSKIEKLTENISADIFILPEMFATGFTRNTKMAEDANGASLKFMRQLACAKDMVVCASIPYQEAPHYYNRFFWVEPNGNVQTYDKRHLFSFDREDSVYTAGQDKLIIQYQGWRICPLICYDLRFPVWSRNVDNIDLYIYVASWPHSREDAWQTLLKARAIENMAFVAGVNRSGTDGNHLKFSGKNRVYNALGEIEDSKILNHSTQLITLNKAPLTAMRKRFAFLNDRDDFIIH